MYSPKRHQAKEVDGTNAKDPRSHFINALLPSCCVRFRFVFLSSMRRIHSLIQNSSSLQENKISIYEITSNNGRLTLDTVGMWPLGQMPLPLRQELEYRQEYLSFLYSFFGHQAIVIRIALVAYRGGAGIENFLNQLLHH